MTIRCAACGQDMIVDQAIEDGQHVKCPFCGETTVYSKPTRIALPSSGFSPKNGPKVRNADAVSEPLRNKPKLAVIRPSGPAQGTRSSGCASNECGERRRAKNGARSSLGASIQKLCWNTLAVGLVAAAIYIGWNVFRQWTCEDDVTPSSGRTAPNRDQMTVDHVQEKGCEEKSRHADSNQVVKVRTDNVVEKTPPRDRDGFKRVKDRFLNAKVLAWRDLEAGLRPGKIQSVFSLWCPIGDSSGRFYEVTSSTTGVVSMIEWLDDGTSSPLENGSYEKIMMERGGFVCRGGEAYFVTARQESRSMKPPLGPSESFDPSAEYFGAARDLIRECGMKAKGVKFEIRFAHSAQESVELGSAMYGEKVPYARFKKAVAPLVRALRTVPDEKLDEKRPRMTVVFYDGDVVRRGMDGVTKIPRRAHRLSGSAYDQWLRLRSEAFRQESTLRDFESKQRRMAKECQRKRDAPPTDEETLRVLAAGAVHIKRK